jgi:hypothetical protein
MYDGSKPNPKNPVINVCSVGLMTGNEYNRYFANFKGDSPDLMDNYVTNAVDYCADEGYNPPVALGNIVASSVTLEMAKLGVNSIKKLKSVPSKDKFTSLASDSFFSPAFSVEGEVLPGSEELGSGQGTLELGSNERYAQADAMAGSKRSIISNSMEVESLPAAEETGGLVKLFKLPVEAPSLLFSALGKEAIGIATALPRTLAGAVGGGTEGAVAALKKALTAGAEDAGRLAIVLKEALVGVKDGLQALLAAITALPGAVMAIVTALQEGESIGSLVSAGIATFLKGLDYDALAAAGETLGITVVVAAIFQVVFGSLEFGFQQLSVAIGNSTSDYASSYCHNIGDRFDFMNDKNYIGKGDNKKNTLSLTEWAPFDTYNDYNSCHFNDYLRGYKVHHSAACCNGACSIIGSGLRCSRQNFLGDATVCCFNDYNCNQNDEDSCFQTPARQRTCDPAFRNLNSNQCRTTIKDYCTGDALFPSQSDWLEMWLEDSYVEINSFMAVENITVVSDRFNPAENTSIRGQKYPGRQKQPCLRAIARAVTPNSSVCSWEDLQGIGVIQGNINSSGFLWSKEIVDSIYNRFVRENGGVFIGGLNTDGYGRNSGFYNVLWDICNKIPGLCVDILPKICQDYTPETLVNTPGSLPWCSCWMPDSSYEKYEKFGIQRECSPLCNRPGVLPYLDNNFMTKVCVQSVCMMDDITVGLINTQFKNGVNFNQICGSCGAVNINTNFSVKSVTTGDPVVKSYLIVTPFSVQGKYLEVYGNGYDLFDSGRIPCYIIPTDRVDEVVKTPEKYNVPICTLIIGSDQDGNVGVVGIDDYNVPFSNPSGGTGVIDIAEEISVGDDVVLGYTFPSWNKDFGVEGKISVNFSISGFPEFNQTDIGVGKLKPIVSDNIATTKISNILSRGSSNTVTASSTSETSSYISKANRQISADNCRCIMDNKTYGVLESQVGSLNLTQHCGNTSTCTNSQGEKITCGADNVNVNSYSDVSTIEINTSFQEKQEKYSNIFFMILAGLFALLLIFIVGTSARKYDRMNFSRL